MEFMSYPRFPRSWPLVWAILLAGPAGRPLAAAEPAAASVEQWGVFELTLAGPSTGNPFTEVELAASFTQGNRTLQADGFYDGAGVYKIRFMPDTAGEWRYATSSNRPELDGKNGGLVATAPAAGSHGPVRVRNTYDFAY